MKDDSPVEKLLLKGNPRGLERILGVVCLCVGFLLALFALALIQGTLFGRPHGGVYALLVIASALAYLFLVAGIRLLRGKRNSHESLFAPWVCFSISGTLLFTAAVFVAASDPTFAAGQGIASALLLALLAYGAGSHSRAKSLRKGRGAA